MQVLQGPIERLHLANAVVCLQVLHLARVPQLAVQGLHAGRAHLGLGHVHLQTQQADQAVGVLVGLGGEIARVHPDHLHGGLEPAHQVQRHRRLDPKAGGEGKAIAKALLAPAQASKRIELLQLGAGQGGVEGGCLGRHGHHLPMQLSPPWRAGASG